MMQQSKNQYLVFLGEFEGYHIYYEEAKEKVYFEVIQETYQKFSIGNFLIIAFINILAIFTRSLNLTEAQLNIFFIFVVIFILIL